MRLKSLSIKGFKSFADDTIINFNENLIGIVGPNGSGKSNIVDAIRWVLGEQKTSELRLESMSDVLFNGTKTRKEGRVARVTLSFDNTKNVLPTDYNEVSISRILYRDGSSEYRLNNVTCRKKDITSLFLDSGIGSNSYAIISLNMVEDILHDNGGSRRYMIEQAAGISKYKVRKKETLSKLKSTSEDLERVNDLLYEIDKNLSSFERQAKRTEKYNKLKAEYKELAVVISKKEIIQISDSLKQLREKLKNEQDQRINFDKQLIELTAKIEKLKTSILQFEQSLSKDQHLFNRHIEELGKLENQKNLLNQQNINHRDRIKTLDNNEENLKENSQISQQKASKAKEQLEVVAVNIDKEKANVKILEQEHQKLQLIYQELRSEEKRVKSEAAKQQLVKNTAEKELESLDTQIRILTNDIQILNQRSEQNKTNQKTNLSEFESFKKSHQEQEAILDKLTEQVKLFQEQENKLFEGINSINQKKNKKDLELSSIKQRVKFLKNIIENNEGVPESIKHLLEGNKDLTLFSDIIEINDSEYTSIIELFFEPYLHHVIVNDAKEGLDYVSQIKKSQKGKIKLFVLSHIKANSKENKEHEKLIPLSSVISTAPQYQQLIDHLSGSVYLYNGRMEDIDTKALNDGTIVLFKDDYLIISKSEIYGGSNTLFEGVQLGRKQILDKLLEQGEILAQEIEKIEEELNTAKSDKIQISKSLKEIRFKQQDQDQKLRSKQQKLYHYESTLNNISNNQDQIKSQLEAKRAQLSTANEHKSIKENHLLQLAEVNIEGLTDNELAEKINEVYNKLTESNSLKEAAQQSLYKVESEYKLIKKEEEFHSNLTKSVDDQLDRIILERKELNIKIEEGGSKLITVEKELKDQYLEKDKLQKKLSEYEDTYYKEKGKIFEKEKELNEVRNKLSQKESFINTLNEKIATQQFDLKAIHDRNEIEFGFKIVEVEIEEEFLTSDLNDLKFKKEKLQSKIRSFGEINPMAITAYNEIKERHEYITKEQNDIISAKNSLEETIKEIEEAASAKFTASLEAIKVNFKNVFQGLFSEDDNCDIVLMDTDNPLDARIEIVAKPKGKRPKSISQLSGGEKTLTAASFLFALYLLKPAPFCIFDEVDAPLDDVNVQKFNKIIRKFSADSQFIIITHNKLTMAEVDILYGVFLKEQGVSGVSAVDFRKYDQAELLESTSN